MKIAISATGRDLESFMDQRFGRATNILFVETRTLEYLAIRNEGALDSGGAGVSAAQIVIDNDAQALITGNIGPNAMNVLNAANIEIFKGCDATVNKNVEHFKKGELEKIISSVPSHFGMGLK